MNCFVESLEGRAMFADVMGGAAMALPAAQKPAASITDGTSNTIMVAEAHPSGVNVVMCDGSVRFLKDTIVIT